MAKARIVRQKSHTSKHNKQRATPFRFFNLSRTIIKTLKEKEKV